MEYRPNTEVKSIKLEREHYVSFIANMLGITKKDTQRLVKLVEIMESPAIIAYNTEDGLQLYNTYYLQKEHKDMLIEEFNGSRQQMHNYLTRMRKKKIITEENKLSKFFRPNYEWKIQYKVPVEIRNFESNFE
jgi:hypothetical protein